MNALSHVPSYHETARSAHDIADILKRRRPELCSIVEDLRSIVIRAQAALDELRQVSDRVAILNEFDCRNCSGLRLHGEAATALNNLEAAYQALIDLKHLKYSPHRQLSHQRSSHRQLSHTER